MPITRSQYKKYQEQIQINNNHDNKKYFKITNDKWCNKNRIDNFAHNIDFVDASLEWRKNKIMKQNCCFEYL